MKTLPEPGVDVFIRYKGKNVLARRMCVGSLDAFKFAYPVDYTEAVGASTVEWWDYAVPAGDIIQAVKTSCNG